MLDCMNNSLELLELVELDLPLGVSILISINTIVENILIVLRICNKRKQCIH